MKCLLSFVLLLSMPFAAKAAAEASSLDSKNIAEIQRLVKEVKAQTNKLYEIVKGAKSAAGITSEKYDQLLDILSDKIVDSQSDLDGFLKGLAKEAKGK